MKRLAWAVFLLCFSFAGRALAEPHVVVELFTSQACAKCPPANKLFSELADKDEIIALNWHVDYWDFMGWKDTLARPENGTRQEAYNKAFDRKGVYTPQVVINGRRQVVGSHKLELLQTVRSSLVSNELPLTLRFLGGKDDLRIQVDGPRRGLGSVITLIWYDSVQNVKIASGENAGRIIKYANVVRHTKAIGEWRGERWISAIDLDDPARNGSDCIAVLVQDGPGGRIIGAAKITLKDIGA